MTKNEALKSLTEKFTWGNCGPVSRVIITLEEWEALRQALAEPEENEMKPHTHEKYIKAWAEGKAVQFRTPGDAWVDVGSYPCWMDNQEHRIKPADPVVRWLWVYKSNIFGGLWSLWGTHYMSEQDAKERAESGLEYKKLEWSRETFDE